VRTVAPETQPSALQADNGTVLVVRNIGEFMADGQSTSKWRLLFFVTPADFGPGSRLRTGERREGREEGSISRPLGDSLDPAMAGTRETDGGGDG
jgi:hypothetical protein